MHQEYDKEHRFQCFTLCRSRVYNRSLYDQQENPVAACDVAGPRYQSTHRLFCFCFPFIFRCSPVSLFSRRHVEANRIASTSESNYFVALVGNGSRLPVSRIRKRWTYGSGTKPTYWNSTTWARRQRRGYPDPSWLAFSLLGSQLSDVRGQPRVRLGHFTLTNT